MITTNGSIQFREYKKLEKKFGADVSYDMLAKVVNQLDKEGLLFDKNKEQLVKERAEQLLNEYISLL